MKNAVRNRYKFLRCGICFLMIWGILLCSFSPAMAATYQYNENDVAVPAPDGYSCYKQVRSDQFFKKANWDPTDLFVDQDGNINVLDSADGNVHIFDRDLNYLSTVTFMQDGLEAFLMGISGLYVDGRGKDKTYYVADPQKQRVIIADAEGNITREILQPDTDLVNESISFAPTKVLLDKNDNLYVLVPGIYMGACVFSGKKDFEFLSFIGSNPIESTTFVLADYLWKQILNKEQIANMKRYVPVAFSNFTLDAEGYLYTVTNKSSMGSQYKNEIKKFNTNNLNILSKQDYGDMELGKVNNILQDTSYIDIAVNEKGYMCALDANLCRVNIFDKEGNRLFTFGDRMNTVGSFDTLSAIDVIGNDIYVLDEHYETISLFKPTSYGQKVLDAVDLYNEGKYTEAEKDWQDILKLNAGFSLANVGIGKSLMQKKQYQEAMQHFRMGKDRENYSNAFSIYRSVKMQAIFPILFALGIILFVSLLVGERRLKRKNNYLVNPMHKKLSGKIVYSLFHPSEGNYVLARHTNTKITSIFSICVVTVWFVASVIDWKYSGFIFNTNNLENFEVSIHLLKTFIFFGLWILSSWFVSNLMNSSARMSDLIIVSAVALLPYIASVVIHTAVSNMVTILESDFMICIQVFLIIWAIVILIAGLKEIHEMSMFKTIVFILFTVLGILMILFLVLLLWSLFQQVFSFGSQIWTEFTKMIG